MNDRNRQMSRIAAEALESCADDVRPIGEDRWTFCLDARLNQVAAVRLGRDWLVFRAPLEVIPGWRPPLRIDHFAQALALNASLPCHVKLALDNSRRRLALAAEAPLEDEADLADLMRKLVDALAQATRQLLAGAREATPRRPAPSAAPGADAADLSQLCSQAGWPASARGPGKLAIALDVPDDFYQAILWQENNQAARLRASLEGEPPGSPTARAAIAALLLSAAHEVRMVRPALSGGDPASGESAHLAWEMLWDRLPRANELHHALAALSIACRLTGAEAEALRSDSLAQEHLALRGWSAQGVACVSSSS